MIDSMNLKTFKLCETLSQFLITINWFIAVKTAIVRKKIILENISIPNANCFYTAVFTDFFCHFPLSEHLNLLLAQLRLSDQSCSEFVIKFITFSLKHNFVINFSMVFEFSAISNFSIFRSPFQYQESTSNLDINDLLNHMYVKLPPISTVFIYLNLSVRC